MTLTRGGDGHLMGLGFRETKKKGNGGSEYIRPFRRVWLKREIRHGVGMT